MRVKLGWNMAAVAGWWGVLLSVGFGLTLEALAGNQADSAPPEVLWVGAARVDVTPTTPIRLSGYGSRVKESSGVVHSLWAKAIAFSDGAGDAAGEKLAVLVTIDTTGVSQSFTDAVWERVSKQVPLERDQFALTCTHTHSAPMVTEVLPNLFSTDIPADQQERIDAYTKALEEDVVRVVLEAFHDRSPCRVVWGMGHAGFAKNRRTAGGPVDLSLPVLAAYQADGTLKGLLTTYACHCTTLGGDQHEHCGDWAGFAQAFLEARLPGSVAMVSIGCGADANPFPRGTMAHAVQHGRELANEVEKVLASDALKAVTQPPMGQRETLDLSFEPLPSRTEWEERAGVGGITGYHAKKNLKRLDRGEALPGSVEYTVQTWAFGNDVAMIFLPGEVVVDYALRLKRELDRDRLWVHGYANEVRGYIPSERILREGGYEGGGALPYYDLPTRFATGIEEQIVASVRSLVPESFHRASETPDASGAPAPKEAGEALNLFKTHEDLRVELVVAEPLVLDPVAIDFGADGRLWVVEMRDYPSGMNGNWEAGGRVKVLSDSDGDGTYDTANVFLDGLPFPTGVMVWGEGVLVCAAPDILYAVDTDGDGRADRVEKWLTGFATENYQARVNGLSLGLDNWIHGANGLLGGTISGRFGGESINIRGRDFRFHPGRMQFEAESGISQQGRVRSEWGDWYGSDNGTPGWHYPISDVYLRRNPWVNAPPQGVHLSTGDHPIRVWPDSPLLERFNDPGHANQVTSGCGQDIYRDDLMGKRFTGDFFLCEPVHNLVLRRKVERQGGLMVGRHPTDEDQRDFLTSSDNWFRPVQVRTGPDGALWVVDMYRYVIEHPRWIAPARLAELDVRAGSDRGRIYRVTSNSSHELKKLDDLTKFDSASLVARMDTPHGAERDRVRQVLWHRSPETDAIDRAGSVLTNAQHPAGRAQVMSVLAHWGRLTGEQVQVGLKDKHPGVRRQALIWAETLWRESPDMVEAMVRCSQDSSDEVRFQAALSLGSVDHPVAFAALASMMATSGGDAWFRWALLSAAPEMSGGLFREFVRQDVSEHLAESVMAEYVEGWVRSMAGQGDEGGLVDVAKWFGGTLSSTAAGQSEGLKGWQVRLLSGLLASAESGGRDDGDEVATVSERTWVAELDRLQGWQDNALSSAIGADADPVMGAATLGALARLKGFNTEAVERVVTWLGESERADGGEYEQAALRFLAGQAHPNTGRLLLAQWEGAGPGKRVRWLGLLLSRDEWARDVVGSMESGVIASTEVVGLQRLRLREVGESGGWIARINTLPGMGKDSGRAAVLSSYKAVGGRTGRMERGREIFQQHCASCHVFRGDGVELGPDVSLFRDKTVDDFLAAILDPNAIIEPRYVAYSVHTVDDRTLTGVLQNESGTGFTIVQAGGVREVFRHSDVRSVQAMEISLMPEGFEELIDVQGMADLIAHLKGGQPPVPFGSSSEAQVSAGRSFFSQLPGEDLARVVRASEQFDYPSWLGTLPMLVARLTGEASRIVWETEVASTNQMQDGRLRVRFPMGMGYVSQPAGTFTLKINGKNALRFGVSLRDERWESDEGQVRLSYVVREVREQDSNGYGILDMDPAWVTFGEPVRLEVVGDAVGSERWFGLYVLDRTRIPSVGFASDADKANAVWVEGILDGRQPDAVRNELIARYADRAPALILEMTADLEPRLSPGGAEEYRRIPWVWRVAIAAGRRNDANELRRILEVSLPRLDQPLLDWQAVVVGGGVINGISLEGVWPDERLKTVLAGDTELAARWERALEVSIPMAGDPAVPSGTRYDALRMAALLDVDRAIPVLRPYLGREVNAELQQGAVSGLGDVPDERAMALLRSAFPDLTPGNRELAEAALKRWEAR